MTEGAWWLYHCWECGKQYEHYASVESPPDKLTIDTPCAKSEFDVCCEVIRKFDKPIVRTNV